MKASTKKPIALVALLVGGIFAANAQADIISGGSFSNGLQVTEIAQSGVLSLFDSSLGTLTQVNFTFTGDGDTTLGATNNAAQSQTFRINSEVDLSFGSTNGAINTILTTGTIGANQPLVILNFTTGNQILDSGASASYGPFTNSNSDLENITSGLAAFQAAGGGTFTVNCNSLSGITVVGGGGNISTTQSTHASCGASIEYVYTTGGTTVPEPTTMSLLGLGLAGFAASRRRNANKAA